MIRVPSLSNVLSSLNTDIIMTGCVSLISKGLPSYLLDVSLSAVSLPILLNLKTQVVTMATIFVYIEN